MKILLDECLPIDFRHNLPGHDVHTVQWAGFKGKKNGDLLQSAELAGYEVFLTFDHGIPHQTCVSSRKISVVVVRSRTNQIDDLLPLVEPLLRALEEIKPAQTIVIAQR